MMLKRRRLMALAVCAVMALSLIVSSAFIVREATHHHTCTGEDCPICQFIAQVEQVRRGFGMLLLALLTLAFALAVRREIRADGRGVPFIPGTPVSLKIRLND